MTQDIIIRVEDKAGRITLNRPQALNAMTYQMCLAIEAALDDWRDDPDVRLVVIDAAGDKAFCAGGDIQQLYDTGRAGDFAYGQKFWADEYRLNAKIADYPKPYVALMQGFTMGGGVGISCHGSHRIVGESSRIAMPECGIGLVPDVGGSWLLSRAPGSMGEYLGLTAARMEPGDAIYAGFADTYVVQADWPALISDLEMTGDVQVIATYAEQAPTSLMAEQRTEIDAIFGAGNLADIGAALALDVGEFASDSRKALGRNSPLSMAVTLDILRRLRSNGDLHKALDLEYRFTARAMEMGDFLEGIRAAIIDKDRRPKWRHSLEQISAVEVTAMLAPLGSNGLKLTEVST